MGILVCHHPAKRAMAVAKIIEIVTLFEKDDPINIAAILADDGIIITFQMLFHDVSFLQSQ